MLAKAATIASVAEIVPARPVHMRNRALDLAVTVQSSRCTQAITNLRARIQPFHTVTVARDFDERARLILATSHQT